MPLRGFAKTPAAQLGLVAALALVHAFVILFIGLDKPLLDQHSFRQTQTALSAYWLLQGGPLLSYETPVLGAPWSIPFEFPLYQAIVAGIAYLGVPLEIAGRLVSFAFFVGALWPLRVAFRQAGFSTETYLITATIYLFSPIYLFWGRTFMIETCAMFFALSWLAALMVFADRGGFIAAVTAIVAGTLGVLAKSTTFPAFAAVGGIYIAGSLWRGWRAGVALPRLATLAISALAIALVPLAIGVAWVAHSDALKSANEFGAALTSKNLAPWNFGTLQQRLGRELWTNVIFNRAVPDTLGFLFPVVLLASGAALIRQNLLAAMIVMAAAFLFAFLLFTNLHIVHNYYQSANAIFLVVLAGLTVATLFHADRRWTARVVLTLLIGGQIAFFHTQFTRYLVRDYSDNRLLQVSLMAREHTPRDSALLVIGDEWASTVPFYAQRKGHRRRRDGTRRSCWAGCSPTPRPSSAVCRWAGSSIVRTRDPTTARR